MKQGEYEFLTFGDERFNLREAASISGLHDKTLRNWIERRQVVLNLQEKRSAPTWHRLTMREVLRITLIGKLKAFGVPVKEASNIIDEMLKAKLPSEFHVTSINKKWSWTALKPETEGIFITLNIKKIDDEMMSRYNQLERRD